MAAASCPCEADARTQQPQIVPPAGRPPLVPCCCPLFCYTCFRCLSCAPTCPTCKLAPDRVHVCGLPNGLGAVRVAAGSGVLLILPGCTGLDVRQHKSHTLPVLSPAQHMFGHHGAPPHVDRPPALPMGRNARPAIWTLLLRSSQIEHCCTIAPGSSGCGCSSATDRSRPAFGARGALQDFTSTQGEAAGLR